MHPRITLSALSTLFALRPCTNPVLQAAPVARREVVTVEEESREEEWRRGTGREQGEQLVIKRSRNKGLIEYNMA